MSQYAFSLNLDPVFSADNFFISDSNREAHALVTRWPDWSAPALILYGESGAGKSHLAQLWAQKSGAALLEQPGADSKSNALIENIERIEDERALLHLINSARENKHYLLLTAALPPKQLPFGLPDLTSRLLALPAVSISSPDDGVLAAAMRKQFSDRQLKVEEEVIAYLLPRMERSFSHIKETVEQLDGAALREQKNITIPFARRILNY